jgi:hypothetical protein
MHATAAPADARFQRTLLRAWEQLHGAGHDTRALGLLQAVWPQPAPMAWHAAPLGERDAALFRLHAALFGPDLQTLTHCPACGEALESQFDCARFYTGQATPPAAGEALRLQEQDWDIAFRLPSSADVMALDEHDADPAVLVAALLHRCVLDARRAGQPTDPGELPPALIARLEERMSAHDPLADLRLDVCCPACATQWSAVFDIGAYLWEAFDDWAQDLLAEVHQLARGYGWRERDILALSPVRRRFYLDLVTP